MAHRPDRRFALPLLAAAGLLGLTGCAAGPSAAAAPASPAAAPATTAAAAGPSAAAERPDPCALVSDGDVSLYVALADWQVSAGDDGDRSFCQYAAGGFTVTVVTAPLVDPRRPPAGLCAPAGSQPIAPLAEGLLCAYAGPGPDTATAVVAGAGLGIGVRVAGPDPDDRASTLALHAATHL
jgi:hypothetical protein